MELASIMTTRVKIGILFGVAVFIVFFLFAPKASNVQLAAMAVLIPLAGMVLNVVLPLRSKK
jgi:hypothetical protein